MNSAKSPNPTRRWAAILLLVIVVLSFFVSLYVKSVADATHASPPRWLGLIGPLNAAVFGVVFLLTPENFGFSAIWRRRAVIFFFGMSALMLTMYFI